jgi:hypothetical protein
MSSAVCSIALLSIVATLSSCSVLKEITKEDDQDRTPKAKKSPMKIVFSRRPIDGDKKPKKKHLTRRFKLGDPIYVRIYTKDGESIRSHQDRPGSPLGFELTYPLEGESDRPHRMTLVLSEEELEEDHANLALLPKKGGAEQEVRARNDRKIEVSAGLVEILLLRCEEHDEATVRFDMFNWGSAEFEVECSDKGAQKAKKRARIAMLEYLEEVRMEKPSMRDRKLERKMLKVAEKAPQRVGGGEMLRAVITSSDWRIDRNEITGAIESRTIWAEIARKVDDEDGICYLETVIFREDYDGRHYSRLHIPGTVMDGTREILCDNID